MTSTVCHFYTLQKRPALPTLNGASRHHGRPAARRGAARRAPRAETRSFVASAQCPDPMRALWKIAECPHRAGKLPRGCAGVNRAEGVAARHSAFPVGTHLDRSPGRPAIGPFPGCCRLGEL